MRCAACDMLLTNTEMYFLDDLCNICHNIVNEDLEKFEESLKKQKYTANDKE